MNTKSILAFSFVLAFIGCSDKTAESEPPREPDTQAQQQPDTPTESDAQQKLETQIQQQSNGLMKLVSFQKTDGVAREVMGVKAYEMSYAAEVEFLDDCLWNGGNPTAWDGNFDVSRPAVSSSRFRADVQVFREATKKPGADARWLKGDHFTFNGRLTFQKTERGWH